jgi:hypothetical protein
LTTPTTQDFYLVGCQLSVIKDVTSPSTLSTISATIGGASQHILSIAGITLTAQSSVISIAFPIPLKIDRNTNITVTNTSATATINTIGNIYAYVVDNSLA